MVTRYSGTVYNLALRLTDDSQEAEDVLQETFLSAFRAIDRFEGRSQLGTWLYRIAYNAALMRVRKRGAPTASLDEPLLNEDGDTAPRQLADTGALPDEVLLTAELRAELSRALGALPPTLRSVFVLRDIEGLSTAATAEVLGLSVTNTKVRLHRARLALRERLGAYFAGTNEARQPREERGVEPEVYVSAMHG
jgi:RNA polymerase sigma-70 factor (ECF subfamily)